MMDREVHQLLLEADEFLPKYEYLPPDFDYLAAIKEVKAFTLALASLGYSSELDTNLQDATFFAELWCSQEAFGIRFSGSGRLVLISTGAVWEQKGDGFPADLMGLLQEYNYKVICSEQLGGALYDGTANQFNTPITWFERYFDYL